MTSRPGHPIAPIAPIDPRRVRAAVFDLGGVLLEGGPREVVAFGTRVGLDAGTWDRLRRELFGNSSPWARLERGLIAFDDFVAELSRRVEAAGGTITPELAVSFMGDRAPMSQAARLRHDMIEAVRGLHEVMPTALLTNNVREWRDGWRNVLDVDALFDIVIDSSEVGARKPDPEIYHATRERLDVDHQAIFFIDDIGQNLKAARALGWQTFLFEEPEAAIAIIDEVRRAHAAITKRARRGRA